MTFSHDQIRDHLVDFLAGELTGEARAAFDAHLSSCDACRVEVRGFEKARSVAREVIRAPLEQPIPPGLRARVLAAAAAQQEQAKGATGASQPLSQPNPSWLARWFGRPGARWTFPTFATVAAMAAFLLVRETVFKEAKHPLPEAPSTEGEAPPTLPAAAAEPAPANQPPPSDTSGAQGAPASQPKMKPARVQASPRRQAEGFGVMDDGLDSLAEEKSAVARDAKAGRGGGSTMGKAAERRAPGTGSAGTARNGPSPSKEAAKTATQAAPKHPAKAGLDELLEGSSTARRERTADKDEAQAMPQKPSTSRSDLEAELDRAPAAAKSAPSVPAPSARAPSSSARPPTERAFAAPPPPAPSARPTSSGARSRASADGAGVPISSFDEASPAAAPGTAKPSKKSESPRGAAAAAPSAPASRAESAQADSADPVPPLVDHAEKLMVARRFSEAAVAYRDLLRRFPSHPSVPAWRQRLATAEAAGASDGFARPPPSR